MSELGVREPSIESTRLCALKAAVYLRISERALDNFLTLGGGPAYRKHGNRVVYRIDEFDARSKAQEYFHAGGADRP